MTVPQATKHLITQVAALGERTSEKQIKRLRRQGLIAQKPRPGRGRGQGRPATGYEDGAAETVAASCRILRTHPKARYIDLPMWLFVEGLEVNLDLVRASVLGRHAEMHRGVPDASDVDGMAERFAKSRESIGQGEVGRLIRTLSGDGKLTFENPLHATIEAIQSSQFGGEISDRDIAKTAELFRWSEAFEIEDLGIMLREYQIRNAPRYLADLTDDELIEARDFWRRAKVIFACETAPDISEELQRAVEIVRPVLARHDAYDDMMLLLMFANFPYLREQILSSNLEPQSDRGNPGAKE